MKKKIIILIISVTVILLALAGITFFTNILFNGKYNVLKKSDATEESKTDTDDNNNYVYVCADYDKDKDSVITTIAYRTSIRIALEKESIKALDLCKKYRITCEDEEKKQYDCNDVGIEIDSPDSLYYHENYYVTYFTYKIKDKEYIKSFKTNKFILDPNDYDEFTFYEKKYLLISKNNSFKTYDIYNKKYISFLDGYKLIDAKKGYEKHFYAVKNKNSNYQILYKTYDSSEKEFLDGVKIDKILSIGYFVLIISDNKVKLFDESGSLLYDYGKIDGIKSAIISNMPRIEGTTGPESEDTKKYKNILIYNSELENGTFVFLKYNRLTKQGSIEYQK